MDFVFPRVSTNHRVNSTHWFTSIVSFPRASSGLLAAHFSPKPSELYREPTPLIAVPLLSVMMEVKELITSDWAIPDS